MFTKLAEGAAHFAGHPSALVLAVVGIVLGFWLFSIDTVNIAISIVSLMLLLLIQASVNRDSLAVEAKLDDIIQGVKDADNRYIGIDRLSESEIKRLRDEERFSKRS